MCVLRVVLEFMDYQKVGTRHSFETRTQETEITKKGYLKRFFTPGTRQCLASKAIIPLENGGTTRNEKANSIVPGEIENGRDTVVWS